MTKGLYDTLLEILKPRTIIAMAFYMVYINLVLAQLPIPPELNTMISTLFGYWYGSRKAKKEEK